MGVCCTKMESLDHVESIENFKHLVSKDISMFNNHHKLLVEDNNFKNNQMKSKQIEFLDFILKKMKVLDGELKDFQKMEKDKLDDLKDCYKEISNCIISQNQEIIEEKFKKISTYLDTEKIQIR